MGLFAEYRPGGPRGAPVDGLVLRPAGDADLPAVAALRAARDGMEPAEAQSVFERQLARARDGEGLVLVARAGEAVAGYGVTTHFAPPPGAPHHCAPEGWYLTGVVVDPAFRRRGVGDALTRARLRWIAARAPVAWYFASARNRTTIDLHARLGFREVTRDFWFPKVSFTGGVGILFRADLPGPGSSAPTPPPAPA